MGFGEARANVIVNDLNEDMTIWSENEPPISIGDEVSVTCGASAHKYANELNWYKDDVLIQSGDSKLHEQSDKKIIFMIVILFTDVKVESHNTGYSHRKEIRWSSVTGAEAGKYECRANVIKDDSLDSKSWDLEVVKPKRPEVEDSNIENGKSMKSLLGEPLQLRCKFLGIPRPKITWYKDGSEITHETNDSRLSLHNSNTILDLQYIKAEDEGRYKCVAANRIGSVSLETELKITSNDQIISNC